MFGNADYHLDRWQHDAARHRLGARVPAVCRPVFRPEPGGSLADNAVVDLVATLVFYRFFGKTGLQVAIAIAIILANLQGPKLTIIFGIADDLGVIFYSSIFFATDVLSENYGQEAANKAVRMGFAVSVIVLIMLSLALLYLPSTQPGTAEFSATIHNAFATISTYAALYLRLAACLLHQPALRRLGVSQDQDHDRRTWLWLRNNGSTLASQVVDTASTRWLRGGALSIQDRPQSRGGEIRVQGRHSGNRHGVYLLGRRVHNFRRHAVHDAA